ncbi:MAG TPA: SPOR domain-containing protein [Steroidobacteraceae bacterium]|nr:SPOR domain-containing protein [Steroidobacteraceae bacterium]
MISNKFVLGLCCATVLAIALSLAGCSRQQSDWQKTRETNTADAYEQFLKKYPSGEFTAQAQARVKELYEERDWQKARDTDTPEAYQAFLKQYPEGKWTEEARIRVENFTLAQAPGSGGPSGAGSPASPDLGESATPAAPATPAPKGVQRPTPSGPESTPNVAAASPPKPATKAKSGSYGVQLGAFKSGPAAASEHWDHLQKEYPKLLTGLSSKVVPKKTAEGHLYRLQAVGLSEKSAREVCRALKAKSQPCVVVPPTHG